MRRAISLVLCYLLVLPGIAFADPCVEAVPLDVDNPAPCEGLLLPQVWTIDCVTCRDVDLPRFKLELELSQERATLDLDLARGELEAERELVKETQRLLDLATAKLGPPRWFEHPAFLITIGFVIGTGTTIGIAAAVQR